MARTVGFGKLERQMLSNDRLPPDVCMAVIEFKNNLKVRMNLKTGGKLEPFENREGGLRPAAAGQTYYEHQVGQSHSGDPKKRGSQRLRDPNRRGNRRLVALVDAGGNILKMYFSDAHYAVGQWKQLQYP